MAGLLWHRHLKNSHCCFVCNTGAVSSVVVCFTHAQLELNFLPSLERPWPDTCLTLWLHLTWIERQMIGTETLLRLRVSMSTSTCAAWLRSVYLGLQICHVRTLEASVQRLKHVISNPLRLLWIRARGRCYSTFIFQVYISDSGSSSIQFRAWSNWLVAICATGKERCGSSGVAPGRLLSSQLSLANVARISHELQSIQSVQTTTCNSLASS
jgi:hypothetical protein